MTPDLDALFATAIKDVIGKEGGYSNDPNDRGGETMWGITIAVARAFGYNGAMSAMTQAQAIDIYKARYWTQPGFDQIALIDRNIGLQMLGGGINCGQSTMGTFLQRALNALNNQAKSYPDIKVDGNAGAMTRASLNAFLRYRGDTGAKVLYNMIRSQQSVYYLTLAEQTPTDETFEYGWQLNRAM